MTMEVLRHAQKKEKVRLFPSPVLSGSGFEGIISARFNEHP
jgi:hypothetical protein